MKSKFASYDIYAVIHDLKKLVGMRVVNVYDINSKTYLIKLQKPNDKAFIIFESGIRLHLTTYDWPKSIIPSGFSMKFRKHIRQKRLTGVSQVGIDRIIDMQFGDNERAFHVIVELYDRGNVVLTDHEFTILNILRPRTDADHDVRFSVRERYPLEHARQTDFMPSEENIELFLKNANTGEPLRKSLVKHAPYGAALLDHTLLAVGLPLNAKIGVHLTANIEGIKKIREALEEAAKISNELIERPFGGFIASKTIKNSDGTSSEAFQEYNPYDFSQYRLPETELKIVEFGTFSEAVDAFYSSIEAQKSEHRVLAVEKEADRRIENVRRDHEQRIKALEEVQEIKEDHAEYIQYNREIVDQAILIVRTAIANKMSWNEQIPAWLEQLRAADVPAAQAIVKLRLDSNMITLRLGNPYDAEDPQKNVDIDLGLSAEQNVRKYFDERRNAMQKQNKTEAAKSKAMKSAKIQAQLKVDQAKLKQRHQNVVRARKTYWFEKFLWFISSDDYLVLGGKDAHQNEQLVKRYMRPGDLYVHAEIQGAASVIIRNRSDYVAAGQKIPPPRTLNEAGTLAICFSKAWEEKVVINAYWVHHDQVSKTPQTGEFLGSGGFIIRGKRNFLPTTHLTLGWGLLFRLDEESMERHRLLKKEAAAEHIFESTIVRDQGPEVESGSDESQSEDDGDFPDVQLKIDDLQIGREETVMKHEAVEQPEDGNDTDDQSESENDESHGDDDVLQELTAQPLPEDSLLFGLPVCGPYSAMQHFKFKVKITPGTGKRGKAAKTAIYLFTRDKTLTMVEKTLLKSLSIDDSISQNLPSKIRVSAPHLHTSLQSEKTKSKKKKG